jgi:hypothetical protein
LVPWGWISYVTFGLLDPDPHTTNDVQLSVIQRCPDITSGDLWDDALQLGLRYVLYPSLVRCFLSLSQIIPYNRQWSLLSKRLNPWHMIEPS